MLKTVRGTFFCVYTMKSLVHPGSHIKIQHGALCVGLVIHGFCIQLHWVDDIPIFTGIAMVPWMFISSQLHLACNISIPILLIHVAQGSVMICMAYSCGCLCGGSRWVASISQHIILFILHQCRQ